MNCERCGKRDEGWREVAAYPGYWVHRTGRVWSDLVGRIIKGSERGRYRSIKFPNGKHCFIHRLVCEAFHGPSAPGLEVRHLDGNRYNNAANNLAWGTKRENEEDRLRHGQTPRAEKNPNAKLTQAQVEQMRIIRNDTGASYRELGRQFGVNNATALRAIKGESWK